MALSQYISLAGAVGLSFLKPTVTTYNFNELSGIITHPAGDSFPFIGKGIGSISVQQEGSRTFHEVDVYGNVIVGTRKRKKNGQVQIQCQQTSDLHYWLSYVFNAIENQPSEDWAKMRMILRNITTGFTQNFWGMSFDNMADIPYSSEGQNVNWTLWAARIDTQTPNSSGAGAKNIIQQIFS